MTLGIVVAVIGGICVALILRTYLKADSRVGAYARRNLFLLIAAVLLVGLGLALAFGLPGTAGSMR